MLPPIDVGNQAPGDPFAHDPAFAGHEEPLPVMEEPGVGEMKPAAVCYSDAAANAQPDSELAQLLDGPQTQELDPGGRELTGPATLHRRSRRSFSGGRVRLPQFVQALAEQMLAQGATAEEAAKAARECGFSKVTAAKVNRWLAQDKVARQRIIRRQVKTARDLQASLSATEASPDDALRADAARLGERAETAAVGDSSAADVQDLAAIHRSLRAQLQSENDALKRRAKRLEARKVYLAKRIEQAQMRLDHARLQVVERRLGDLRHALEDSEPAEQKTGGSVFAEIVSSLCQLLRIGD
ncbi:MAG TPA: hypothetical protein VMT20_19520 [Terriglobia bacterium]|nr:hypothetical protein [Terriglobia bacterium]